MVAEHGKATGQGHPGHGGLQSNTGVAPQGVGAPGRGSPGARERHKSRAEPLGGLGSSDTGAPGQLSHEVGTTQGRSHREGALQTRGPQGNSAQTPGVHTVAEHSKATGQGHPGHGGLQGNTGVAPRGGVAPDTGGPRARQLRRTEGGHISRAEPLGGCQTHRGPGQLHKGQ
jgi:hypothetical protein